MFLDPSVLAQQAGQCTRLLQDLVPTALAPSLVGHPRGPTASSGSLADCTVATRTQGPAPSPKTLTLVVL